MSGGQRQTRSCAVPGAGGGRPAVPHAFPPRELQFPWAAAGRGALLLRLRPALPLHVAYPCTMTWQYHPPAPPPPARPGCSRWRSRSRCLGPSSSATASWRAPLGSGSAWGASRRKGRMMGTPTTATSSLMTRGSWRLGTARCFFFSTLQGAQAVATAWACGIWAVVLWAWEQPKTSAISP